MRDAPHARLPDRGGDVLRHVRHAPEGAHDVYVCTNISCSLRGADKLYEAMLQAAGNDPSSTCSRSSASARATSRRWRRSTASTSARSTADDCARLVDDVKAGRPVLEAQAAARHARGRARLEMRLAPVRRTSTSPASTRSPSTARARRLRDARAALDMEPRRRARRAADVRHARPRRRRLRDGHEGVVPAQGRHGQVRRLQRRRVRAGDVQGPRADAEEPAPADRGHLHRRATRSAPTRRSSSSAASTTYQADDPRGGARRGARPPAPGRAHPRLEPRDLVCTAAPAPTSAARRRRCSTRSRASAATRA